MPLKRKLNLAHKNASSTVGGTGRGVKRKSGKEKRKKR